MKYFVSILLLVMVFGSLAITSAKASTEDSSFSEIKSLYGDGSGGKGDG